MRLLNVGGNSKQILIPRYYQGWRHDILDIDPSVKPDICCDAILLKDTSKYDNKYDSVYCSHNLEHFYQHKVKDVLLGFFRVLKKNGFCYIRVPHIMNVMRKVVCYNMELTDTLYEVTGGSICAHDIMYGWQRMIRESGNGYFAHKCAFTPKMLGNELAGAGFLNAYIQEIDFEILAFGFRNKPSDEYINDILRLSTI